MNVLNNLVRDLSRLLNQHILGFNRRKILNDNYLINLFNLFEVCPVLALNCDNASNYKNHKSLVDEIMADGMLLAVQKKRRTVERRLERRFGVERYPQDCAIIRVKQNLVVCDNCGHYHESHTICGHCYQRVKQESNKIIDKIKQHFKFSEPIQDEVHIQYKDEKSVPSNGRPAIEMDEPRPEWFARNLLSKTVGNKWIETNPMIANEELSSKVNK